MIIVIIGAQWGDEGKGKVVDLLANRFDIVARYQGGHNAGHSVYVGEKAFVLRLLPSGIIHQDKSCVLGNGMVVDPKAFFEEIDQIAEQGIEVSPARLKVSSRAHLIMPYHKALDHTSEERLGNEKIGTTLRGIGPAYEDKAGRRGIRVADALNGEVLRARIERNLEEANRIIVLYGHQPLRADEIYEEIAPLIERLRPFVCETSHFLAEARSNGKRILLEGAQATLLDVDHGTYPYVTSSNPTAGGASVGAGIPPHHITGVLGIVRTYATRVGEGPFPTEMIEDEQEIASMRFVRLGLVPELASTKLLAHIVGITNAREMMLTGRFVEAEEALRMGLVNAAVPHERLLAAAVEKAAEIAFNADSALAAVKRLVWANLFEPDLRAVQRREGEEFTAALQGEPFREAVRAFFEKREPRFHGS